ncbi:hypothetical protein ACOME3_006348 [Neoechinorhynchus agilis]
MSLGNEESSIDLRIYDQFSEIRENIDILEEAKATVRFHQSDFCHIVPDSIDLEVPNGRVSTTVTTQNHSLEGEEIFVRTEKTGECKGAIFIDDDSSLVQDIETKRFYYANRSQFEFKSAPMKNVVSVRFHIHDPSVKTAILSYLDRQIKWRPIYRLDVEEKDQNATIKCYAVISNPSTHSYKSAVAYASMTDAAPPPSIDIGDHKEIGGLFQYTISKPFKLSARSDLYEEFLDAKITPHFWSSYETINEKREELKFSRIYEITSNEFLPTGKMSIREQGRIIANVRLDQLPAGAKREIRIGEDSSGLIRRKVDNFKESGRVITTDIEIEITNLRHRTWEYRYKESSDKHDVDYSYSFLNEKDPDVTITGNVLKVTKKLESEQVWKLKVQLIAVKKDFSNKSRLISIMKSLERKNTIKSIIQ